MSDGPKQGEMILYDYITPALLDGSYQLIVSTDVTGQTASGELQDTRYFDVVGPRFSLTPTDVASVYPPRNGHGDYSDSLPMIVLYRRTLPWERDPHLTATPHTTRPNQAPALQTTDYPPKPWPVPWVALLLLEDTDDYIFQSQVSLDQAVSPIVFAALGSPSGITCDAITVEDSLLRSIMPTIEELPLLTHARQVNTDDRELSAGSSDGWFSVVISSRLPSKGAKCRACLVSLEQQSDIVAADAPPVDTGVHNVHKMPSSATEGRIADTVREATQQSTTAAGGWEQRVQGSDAVSRNITEFQVIESTSGALGQARMPGAESAGPGGGLVERVPSNWAGRMHPGHLPRLMRSLVVLHTWQFTCDGTGTFGELMTNLDSGMIGQVATPGKPAVADTGHLRVTLQARAGAKEVAWYRGPLVPFPLTRDPLGPYHSADQALRVTPDTGAEDLTYAAAFEVGRLLAAADARLAQELMRWRRSGYAASLSLAVLGRLRALIPIALPLHLESQLLATLIPTVATSALGRVVQGVGPIADPSGLAIISHAVGLQTARLAAAWGINTNDASSLLGANAGAIGAPVGVVPYTAPGAATITSVANDAAALQQLSAFRQQFIETLGH
jgi:hypothetical protein